VSGGVCEGRYRVRGGDLPIFLESVYALGQSDVGDSAVTMICGKCRAGKLKRVEREGVLERNLYAWLGYYPWQCSACKTRALFRVRGKRQKVRSHSHADV